jgi:NAD(P)-dependent dehydrogenase (short-subunit alcohol dehydrogenase family)
LGSITLASKYTNQPTPAYKISKTALNMLTVQYALEIGSKEAIIFLAVNPGVSITARNYSSAPIIWIRIELEADFSFDQWVQTEKETAGAELPVGTGAKGVLEVVHNAVAADNGKFFNIDVPTWSPRPGQNEYRGGLIPW